MKKSLILIFVLLLTGCTAEYNLKIENDNFAESINIVIPNDDETTLADLTENNQYIKSTLSSDVIYKKSINKTNDNSIFNYKHTFSLNEYKDSVSNKCFENFKIQESDNYYSIIAENFNCYGSQGKFADNYKINISTDYVVLNNNADSKKNNTYTWNINKKNYSDKSIIFQFSKQDKKVSLIDTILPYLISLLVSIFIIFIIFFINNYLKNKNGLRV